MTSKNVPRLRFINFNDGWKKTKLGELCKLSNGVTGDIKLHTGQYRITRIETIADGTVNENKLGYIKDKPSDEKMLQKGDILYSNINSIAHIGKVAIFNSDNTIYHGINLTRLSKYKDNIYPWFVYEYLNSYDRKKWAMSHANPAVSQASINNKELSKMNLVIPSLPEQQHIGNFFSKLDHLIDLHSQKLEQLKKLKRGYLQRMFPQKGETVPRLRFSGFSDDWHNVKVDKLLDHNNIRNKELSITNVESVSNKKGFIKQTDQFEDYSVASKNLSNYIVIKPGMFAYNPSRINVGSIAFKNFESKESIVSPLYVSFKTKNNLDDDFLWYWFKTDWFRYQREKYSEGGVRDTLSFKTLAGMDFLLPSLEEQKKISVFLNKIDCLIEQQNKKVESINDVKKYYLQRMFI